MTISASDVRAYCEKHGLSMQEAKRRLRRKKLDDLLLRAATMTDHGALIVALKIIVEDTYPEDLDRRYPNGRTVHYARNECEH